MSVNNLIKTRPRKFSKEKEDVKPAHLPELYVTSVAPRRSDRSLPNDNRAKSPSLSPIDTTSLFVKVPGPLSPQGPTPPTILVNNLPQIQRSSKNKSPVGSPTNSSELEE